MTESPILCSIDLDAPGKQVGQLQVPRSSNMAGWSNQYVPIVSIAGGDGPTAVVLGGVHGDEPEGQIAALNLLRRLEPAQVHGRLIVIPCVSMDASLEYSRLWPSGANMNRSFPGSPDGSPDEQLAHFLSTEVFPRSEIVVDMHALEFMAASCFTELVAWLTRLQELEPDDRYRIRFRSNPTILWQKRSLRALSCFDTDIVTIESS